MWNKAKIVTITTITLLGLLVLGLSTYIGIGEFQDTLEQEMAQATSDARQQGREQLLIAIYDQAFTRGEVTIAKPIVTEDGETANSPSILLRVIQQRPAPTEESAP